MKIVVTMTEKNVIFSESRDAANDWPAPCELTDEDQRTFKDPDIIHYTNKQRIRGLFKIVFQFEYLNDAGLDDLYNWMIFNYDDNVDNKNVDCRLLSYGLKLFEEMR